MPVLVECQRAAAVVAKAVDAMLAQSTIVELPCNQTLRNECYSTSPNNGIDSETKVIVNHHAPEIAEAPACRSEIQH